MSTGSFSTSRLREVARRYESTVPLGWQEIQGIHKFIEHLEAMPPPDPGMVTCPLCGMTRSSQQPCPYCGC